MSTVELSFPLSSPVPILPTWRVDRMFWGNDMAMDLGTANTLIYVKNRGVLVNEPSLVAVDENTGQPLAVGRAAKEMFGKTSKKIRCVRPMKDGVIADFEMTALMVEYMLGKARPKWSMQKPRIVIGVPSGVTQVEKRAVIEAALACGVREVFLVEEPMASALGAGLPVDQPIGNMIVDIGGGTTEVAIISMNGTMYSHSIRVAGDEMDEAIQRYIKREFSMDVGIFEAERVKLVLGSALPFGETRKTTIFGRDVATGMPQSAEIADEGVRESLQEPISAIISSVTTALEQTTPEVAHDIISQGIYLAGGGALLKGLSERLHRETGIRFHRAQDPLSCVVRGVGAIVDNISSMRALCIA